MLLALRQEKGIRSTNQQMIGYYTNGPPLDPTRPHSFSMTNSIVMTDRDQRREGSRMTTFMQFYVEAQGLTGALLSTRAQTPLASLRSRSSARCPPR